MLDWIETLLTNQESCVINGGMTTKYFKLERGARQGDPIAAYLFIIALEMLFIMIKNDNNVNPIQMCDSTFLYSAYADDVYFCLKDRESVKVLMNLIKIFSKYSDLKPNYSKCEIAGFGILKGVTGALCGLTPVDLTQSTIKLLGMHYSYNETLKNEKNFTETVKKIERVLQIWRQRFLTLQGKITIFKSLAISKIVFIAYLANFPDYILKTLKKIQNDFLWNGKRAKLKHQTLCNSYEMGGLQSVDIDFKIKALQLSWIKRLFDENEHQWKIIPRFFIKKFGSYAFHTQFSPKNGCLREIPKFYKNLIEQWNYCSNSPQDAVNIFSQCLWHNINLKIDNNTFFIQEFASSGLNHIYQLFNQNGQAKTWNQLKIEFHLNPIWNFKYVQLIDSIPRRWKQIIYENNDQINNINTNLGILQCTRIVPLENLTSKQIYTILIRKRDHTPTSKTYYNMFFDQPTNWLSIYMLPRKVTKNAYAQIFQYKILNNILYLNDKLFQFGLSETRQCSFCNNHIKTLPHIF